MAALAADGIFDGTECAPRRFCPRQPVLRWHMAVWMVRIIDGRDPPGIESSPFADVDADLWWGSLRRPAGRAGNHRGLPVRPDRAGPVLP